MSNAKEKYRKEYKRLWAEAEKLPRVEAIKKLKELAELKRAYYASK